MAHINGVSVPFVPIVKESQQVAKKPQTTGSTFDDLFKKELDKIKFSAHAMKRLETSNIEMSDTELSRLQDAVSRAEAKGAKDSLVMMDNKAFIVNIPNKTVVTALPIEESTDNVFTNIDSVVFAQ